MKKLSSITGKIIFIFAIVGLLLIANVFIGLKLSDRENQNYSASESISNGAGGKFCVRDVVLNVPYVHYITKINSNGKKYTDTVDGVANIKAKNLNYVADIKSEKRKVGIYSAPVFTGDLKIEGEFLCNLTDNTEYTYNYKKAVLVVTLKDKSIVEVPVFHLNGVEKEVEFHNGGTGYNNYEYANQSYTDLCSSFTCKEGINTFSTELKIRGAKRFSVMVGSGQTRVSVKSDWCSPGFTDSDYLPVVRNITDSGFTSEWFVPFDSGNDNEIGFSFIQPVDVYKMLDRAVKYGFLFIIVPFIVLFLFELFMGANLHPVHYLLCGAASIVFFLLLLSFSEHIPFGAAYLISSFASGLVTSFYVAAVTGKVKTGLEMSGVFVLMYGYLFFSLKSEDYALLIGSIFTFLIIAVLMFSTRKVDWNNLKDTNLKLSDKTE